MRGWEDGGNALGGGVRRQGGAEGWGHEGISMCQSQRSGELLLLHPELG